MYYYYSFYKHDVHDDWKVRMKCFGAQEAQMCLIAVLVPKRETKIFSETRRT